MAAAAAAAKDASLASTFAKAVEDAFTNFGSNTTGVLPVGEVTASLRQLQLRVDMPQVDELLPPVGAEPLTRAKFESLVDAVLNLQQIVDERRAATQATLRTPPVRDVLSANEGLVGDLFLSHAVMRSHGDRVISHESLLDLLRGLGLVPTRVSEESVRRILRDSGLQAVHLMQFRNRGRRSNVQLKMDSVHVFDLHINGKYISRTLICTLFFQLLREFTSNVLDLRHGRLCHLTKCIYIK